jgi:hypothetical protein
MATSQPLPRHPDIAQILDDIHFVNVTTAVEIEQARSRIHSLIAKSGIGADAALELEEEVSRHLGQLGARVTLAEKAVGSLRPKQKSAGKHRAGAVVSTKKGPAPLYRLSAEQFPTDGNLLPVESSPEGISYRWSAADPEVRLTLALERGPKQELQLFLVALIKPEYSKQMKIIVDGRHLPHEFRKQGTLYVASCALPARNGNAETDVKVVLPGTHSPMELGESLDSRKLGIAISEIRVVKRQNPLSRVIRRVRS